MWQATVDTVATLPVAAALLSLLAGGLVALAVFGPRHQPAVRAASASLPPRPPPRPPQPPLPGPAGACSRALLFTAHAIGAAVRAVLVTAPVHALLLVVRTLYWLCLISVAVLIALKIDRGDVPEILSGAMAVAARARVATQ